MELERRVVREEENEALAHGARCSKNACGKKKISYLSMMLELLVFFWHCP